MTISEKINEAMQTIKRVCNFYYDDDENGFLLCDDCPFYITDIDGAKICKLTGQSNNDYVPHKTW